MPLNPSGRAQNGMALRVYREVGYDGMIMPDRVPQIVGDAGGHKAFAYGFGYIQALLQIERRQT